MRILSTFGFVLVFVIAAYSQGFANSLTITEELQYEYASKLFQDEDFDTASVEFKRFLYFFPESPHKDQAEFKTGQCLFYARKFKEAARIFNRIILQNQDTDLVAQSVFYQSRAFVHLGNVGYAQLVLQNYLKLTDDILVKDKIYFNLAMIEISQVKKGKSDSLDAALNYLSKISEKGEEKLASQSHAQLIESAKQAPQKSPTAAGVLSIVPGAGFLYLERYKDGAISFLLNVGLMVAAYQAWDNDNKALAGVIGFVETGFYSANIYGAVSSAHKYNRAQVLKILDHEFYIQSNIEPENKGIALSLNFAF